MTQTSFEAIKRPANEVQEINGLLKTTYGYVMYTFRQDEAQPLELYCTESSLDYEELARDGKDPIGTVSFTQVRNGETEAKLIIKKYLTKKK